VRITRSSCKKKLSSLKRGYKECFEKSVLRAFFVFTGEWTDRGQRDKLLGAKEGAKERGKTDQEDKGYGV
jgi:hypothetical protein